MVFNTSSGRNERNVIYTGCLDAVEKEVPGSFINAIQSMTFPLSKASQQARQLPEELQSHFTYLNMLTGSSHTLSSSAGCYSQLASCTTLFLFAG